MKLCSILVFAALLAFFSPLFAFAHEGHMVEHHHPYPKKYFSIESGKKIYESSCASCHGAIGDGRGPAATSLKPKPTNFLDLQYMVMQSRVDHYEAISNGRPNTSMAPWRNTLSDKQIWDVIAYIEELFNHRRNMPLLRPEKGTR